MPYLIGFSVIVSVLILISVLIYLPKKPKYIPTTLLKSISNND